MNIKGFFRWTTILLWQLPILCGADTSAAKQEAIDWIAKNDSEIRQWATQIWEFGEAPFEEHRTAQLLTEKLERAGFSVQRGVSGMPTAFVAAYGSGTPVLAIVAEYDGLPRLSQKAGSFTREPLVAGGAGQACGHNLIGAANVGAAIAVKNAMEKHGLQGTLKVYGTPAEEEYIPKVYMVRDGLFQGVDAGILWHPGYDFCVFGTNRALDSIAFTFSADPRQRDANSVDAALQLERSMDLLRKQLPSGSSISFGAIRAGEVPSVSPSSTSIRYFLHAPDRASLDPLRNKVTSLAEQAADLTETRVTVNYLIGIYQRLQNQILADLVANNLKAFLPIRYAPEELRLAEQVQKALVPGKPEKLFYEEVRYQDRIRGADDDGDISWNIPFVSFHGGIEPVGVRHHTWMNTAYTSSTMSLKAMIVSSKAVAATILDLLTDPGHLPKAKLEFREKTKNFVYKANIPEGKTPMDLYQIIRNFY